MTIALLALACGGAEMAARVKAETEGIKIRVYCSLGEVDFVPGAVLDSAQAEAARLFQSAGFQLEWHTGKPSKRESGRDIVAISFSPTATALYRTSENFRALAAAQPYAESYGTVTVFADRVMTYVGNFPKELGGRALGQVLAHEIGHILEGVVRHSDRGLMKANWTVDDLNTIRRIGLPLANDDVQMLQLRFRDGAGVR